MGSYVNFNKERLPGGWLGQAYAQEWAAALGAVEDTEVQRIINAVQARFVPLAPADAIPLALQANAMSGTFDDSAPAWEASPHSPAVGDIVGDGGGFIWTCTVSGTAGLTQPAWPNPPFLYQTQPDGMATWTWLGLLPLPKTRAWLLSAFSSWAIGQQNPWLPQHDVVGGQTVTDNGNVWVSSTDLGTTGTRNPFPPSPSLGQAALDNGIAWSWNGGRVSDVPVPRLPQNPLAPGFALAGGELAALAALVNSGLFDDITGSATDWQPSTDYPRYHTTADQNGNLWQCLEPGRSGSVSPFSGATPELLDLALEDPATGPVWIHATIPQFYRNWDFVEAPPISIGGGVAAIIGAWGATISVSLTISGSGTALEVGTGADDWVAATDYAAGDFVTDSHGHVWQATGDGVSGTSAPDWPTSPNTTDVVTDGGVVWDTMEFSPIPSLVPLGAGSAAIGFDGTFSANDTDSVTYTVNCPDGNGALWARVWLVVPVSNFGLTKYKWGNGSPGDYNGYWGDPPDSGTAAGFWGGSTPFQLYGLIGSLMATWLPGHERFVGAWITTNEDTTLTYPASPWNENTDVTISAVVPPFFRYLNDSE